MKIGILGSKDVAKALATGFASFNDTVVLGSRSPQQLEEWTAQHPGTRPGTFEEAAREGEILVLAVKGTVAAEVLRGIPAALIKDKIIIDATNPIADAAPEGGVLTFFSDINKSLMESLQNEFHQARFVKAFNSVGSSSMLNPRFADGPPTMFLCGNDEDARKTVAAIISKFGWTPEDMGGAAAARALEPLCMLWCIPGFLRGDWVHAFRMLR